MGLLFDTGVSVTQQIQQDIKRTYQYTTNLSQQITKTYAPQLSYSYNPQLILGSPSASIGTGTTQTPQVTIIPYTEQIPTQTSQPQGAEFAPQTAKIGEDNLTNIILLGAIAVGAYFILKKFKTKKRKR